MLQHIQKLARYCSAVEVNPTWVDVCFAELVGEEGKVSSWDIGWERSADPRKAMRCFERAAETLDCRIQLLEQVTLTTAQPATHWYRCLSHQCPSL